jgi:hypothetical protein
MSVTIESMMAESAKKREKRNKLFENATLIECQSEHAFHRACEAMFHVGVEKALDCGIEVFYRGKIGIVCVKWYKEKLK